eukprot:TRINITY_DN549_c0_g1_i1.p1 TRINITY_DN549_c0_g1~~TRINITY_DN549_c0_g1_i1.p1  ORF type:complete len:640 (+),score=170.50 TRINITY_DN549_c0_g1_i1:85-1920(+)
MQKNAIIVDVVQHLQRINTDGLQSLDADRVDELVYEDVKERIRQCLIRVHNLSGVDVGIEHQEEEKEVAEKPDVEIEQNTGTSTNPNKKRRFKWRGYLKKLGGNNPMMLHRWQKRWFRKDGNYLLYFVQKNDLKPKKQIDLSTLTDVSLLEGDRFYIFTMNRRYYFQAESDREARAWINAFRELINSRAMMNKDSELTTEQKYDMYISEIEKKKQQAFDNQEEIQKRKLEREQKLQLKLQERAKREQQRIEKEKSRAVTNTPKSQTPPPSTWRQSVPAGQIVPIDFSAEETENEEFVMARRKSSVSVHQIEELNEETKPVSHFKSESYMRKMRKEQEMKLVQSIDKKTSLIEDLKLQIEELKVQHRDICNETNDIENEEEVRENLKELEKISRINGLYEITMEGYNFEIDICNRVMQSLLEKKQNVMHDINELGAQLKIIDDESRQMNQYLNEHKTEINDLSSELVYHKLKSKSKSEALEELSREQDAFEANEQQLKLLEYEKIGQQELLLRQSQDLKSKIEKLREETYSTLKYLHKLRESSITQSDTTLLDQFDLLKWKYFEQLVISFKINMDPTWNYNGDDNFKELYNTCKEQNIDWKNWPIWVPSNIM